MADIEKISDTIEIAEDPENFEQAILYCQAKRQVSKTEDRVV